MEKCLAPGCERPSKVRGCCASHYATRRKKGQSMLPLVKAENGALLKFLSEHVQHRDEACVLWPYGCNQKGYGHLTFRGRTLKASRVMCILAHGEPPFVGAEAAHSCNNRKCVNPTHISWKTAKANAADKDTAGTTYRGASHWRAVLTAEQVLRIVKDKRPASGVAADYGCTKSAIDCIRSGQSWSWLTGIRKAA